MVVYLDGQAIFWRFSGQVVVQKGQGVSVVNIDKALSELDLRRGATEEQIRTAYRALVAKWWACFLLLLG